MKKIEANVKPFHLEGVEETRAGEDKFGPLIEQEEPFRNNQSSSFVL